MRVLLITAAGLSLLAAAPAMADDSVQNLSTVVEQSGKTAALLAESGIKATAGVLAAPIALTGLVASAIGEASTASGGALENGARGADRFAREPLKVDNDVIVAPQPAPKVPFQAQAPRR